MKHLPELDLPAELKVDFLERNLIGETNDVYTCDGTFADRPISAFIKVSKHPELSLSNEREVLAALADTDLPVPRLIWYGGPQNDILITETLGGEMIWDYIDPRRLLHDPDKAISYLSAYGESLAQIHNLNLPWAPQKRPRLYGLIGQQDLEDSRFRRLVSWVEQNEVQPTDPVFVHGDYNTASVLFDDDLISGIVDWEFAGSGWREYDLAWALRARTVFLDSKPERDAILNGYRKQADFDEGALRYCEVLNYLHFAYWCRENDPTYTSFALDRAMELAGD